MICDYGVGLWDWGGGFVVPVREEVERAVLLEGFLP